MRAKIEKGNLYSSFLLASVLVLAMVWEILHKDAVAKGTCAETQSDGLLRCMEKILRKQNELRIAFHKQGHQAVRSFQKKN